MLSISFFTLLTLFGLALWTNLRRAQQKINFELTNNLLMTKHPLLFVNPRRSLFYWSHPWNQIPTYLSAHGYETFERSLPPSSQTSERTKALLLSLKELSQQSFKFHLFFEQSQSDVLRELLLLELPSSVASLNYLGPQDFEWKGLKSPPLPVHHIALPAEAPPLFYSFHLWLTGQKRNPPPPLGLRSQPQDYHALLQHIQIQAEKDFLESSSNL
ncbi:MAG: hypothetical protein ACK5RO_01585 [Pseudobdellovibrionaceae bacterium]